MMIFPFSSLFGHILAIAGVLVLSSTSLSAGPYFGDHLIHRPEGTLDRPLEPAAVAFGGGVWLSIDPSGNQLRSTDGVNWTHSTLDLEGSGEAPVFSNGVWALANGEGIFFSTDGGNTWNETSTPFDDTAIPPDRIGMVKGEFVAWNRSHGARVPRLFRSSDGISWSALAELPPNTGIERVWYDASRQRFAFLTDLAEVFESSELGGPWELTYAHTGPGLLYLTGDIRVTEDVVCFLARSLGDSPHEGLVVSRDSSGDWRELVFTDRNPVFESWMLDEEDGVFYLVRPFKELVSSTDGFNWSDPQAIDLPGGLVSSLSFVDGYWYGRDQDLVRSADLVTWETVWDARRNLSPPGRQLVTNGRDQVLVLGRELFVLDLPSLDTETRPLPEELRPGVLCSTWDGRRYVAVLPERRIAVSADGASWSMVKSAETDASDFRSIAGAAGVYVASNELGAWRSDDLENWIQTHSFPAGFVDETRVIRDGDRFWLLLPGRADAFSGRVSAYFSPDGQSWEGVMTADFAPTVACDVAEGMLLGGSRSALFEWDGTDLNESVRLPFGVSPTQMESGNGYVVIAGIARDANDNFRLFALDAVNPENSFSLVEFFQPADPWWGLADLLFVDGRFFYLEQASGKIGSFIVQDTPVVDSVGAGELRLETFEGEEGIVSGGEADVWVIREAGSIGSVSVSVATNDQGSAQSGSDFVAQSASLSWAEGESGRKRAFKVPIIDDTLAEGPETIGVELTEVTGGALVGTPAGFATITDSPLEAWRFATFESPNSPSALEGADFDGDGISNQYEFHFSLDPLIDDLADYRRKVQPVLLPGTDRLRWHLAIRESRQGWPLYPFPLSLRYSTDLADWDERIVVPFNRLDGIHFVIDLEPLEQDVLFFEVDLGL